MNSNADRLRILVALAILKHKPAERTCSEYILDLRALFPCGSSTSGEAYWRDHAIRLEKDYASLKIRFEEKEIQSFISANGGDCVDALGKPGVPSTSLQPDNRTDVESSKKKTKKKQAADTTDRFGRRDALLEAGFEKLCQDEILNCSRESGELFASLETLYQLASCHGKPGFPLELFSSAARRVLDAMSHTFERKGETKLNSNHMQTIDTVLRLLTELSFRILLAGDANRHHRIDHIASLLNSLLGFVLMPLVRTFFSLSAQHLQCLLALPHEGLSGSSALFDCRPGLLSLLHSILSCVSSNLSTNAPPRRCNDPLDEREDVVLKCCLELSLLHHSLILDTLRHLQETLGQIVIETENQKSSTHGRVMRLSIKNTIWYICSALHIVMGLEVKNAAAIVTNKVASSSDSIEAQATRLKLLKATALDSLVELLSRLDKKRRMHTATRILGLRLDIASKTSGGNSLLEVPPVPSAIQGVDVDLILLDDMEYRMLMRVVESYSNLV